ncbi:hypothetical protein GUITHDRAFT_111554 [Guillardia theta CCMP2712]|uniref:mitogen-activated protein kinase kinase n=1 Tax=Guillardia theta (strain CCMP2712) TaxID=905079 RepID=L1J2N2_GUITC|nr:hypothetical protein GUITHDRAFT_111554 [Guillardia theta CCMP2712]EKX42582.1 hypothetical protein GUITHDRAFT_111554 [Guillardia theta CCMP2712]|eukprot:XP_005829562.1 hypothetical protein GUITHDRAFT_111554 [Guillardia theta CCMP2712]
MAEVDSKRKRFDHLFEEARQLVHFVKECSSEKFLMRDIEDAEAMLQECLEAYHEVIDSLDPDSQKLFRINVGDKVMKLNKELTDFVAIKKPPTPIGLQRRKSATALDMKKCIPGTTGMATANMTKISSRCLDSLLKLPSTKKISDDTLAFNPVELSPRSRTSFLRLPLSRLKDLTEEALLSKRAELFRQDTEEAMALAQKALEASSTCLRDYFSSIKPSELSSRIKVTFDAYANEKGLLERKQVQTAFLEMGRRLKEDEIDVLMDEFDADNNGAYDLPEFEHMIRHLIGTKCPVSSLLWCLHLFDARFRGAMGTESGGGSWCVYVSFLGVAGLGEVKVPCKAKDSIRHLLIKAKERARMMLPENTDASLIEAADSLIERSGAILFQGDSVSEVLSNGDRVTAISPLIPRDAVEQQMTERARSTRGRSKKSSRRQRTPSTSPEDSGTSHSGTSRSRYRTTHGTEEFLRGTDRPATGIPAAGSMNYKQWQTKGHDDSYETSSAGSENSPPQDAKRQSVVTRTPGDGSVSFSVVMPPPSIRMDDKSRMRDSRRDSYTDSSLINTTQEGVKHIDDLRRLKGGQKTIVYLGHDTGCPSFYREVVVKLMPGNSAGDVLYRWKQEMRTVASLRHPNIVTYFDMGQDNDGSQYLVMEVVPGTDLQQILDTQGYLSEDQTISIVIGVLHALVTAHSAGIVHRDIKPSNIIVVLSTLHIKLIDFGLAKQMDNASLISRIYTPMYFSLA